VASGRRALSGARQKENGSWASTGLIVRIGQRGTGPGRSCRPCGESGPMVFLGLSVRRVWATKILGKKLGIF
jgi:hypothetical protein